MFQEIHLIDVTPPWTLIMQSPHLGIAAQPGKISLLSSPFLSGSSVYTALLDINAVQDQVETCGYRDMYAFAYRRKLKCSLKNGLFFLSLKERQSMLRVLQA